jgi:pimeloyl-ACP methyl ester carboxylesterase
MSKSAVIIKRGWSSGMDNIKPRRWVFLRGLAREAGHWGDFLKQFQEAFPGDKILAVDLPGAGEWRAMQCPRTIFEMWQQVREHSQMEDGPINLFAVSLGAMIGMEWLRTAPEELELCVFVNSSTRMSGPFYRRLRWQIWQRFFRMLAVRKPRERERALAEILMNNTNAREVALPAWTKIALERAVSPQNLLFQMTAAAQFNGLDNVPEG